MDADLGQLGEDVIEDVARRHGIAGLIRLVADIALRLMVEYLSEIRRDLRYAVRALIKSPGFALVGIISLGLGMGITTSVFSRKWSQMFRDLPGSVEACRTGDAAESGVLYYVERYRAEKGLLAGGRRFRNGVPFNVRVRSERECETGTRFRPACIARVFFGARS